MRMSFVRFVAFLMALILCLSVVATALAYNTIPYGEESQDVRDMQSKLKSKGYYKGKVDGKFGPETRRAVRKFQEAIGITVDGKPGNRTLTALYEGTSGPSTAPVTANASILQSPKIPTLCTMGARAPRSSPSSKCSRRSAATRAPLTAYTAI